MDTLADPRTLDVWSDPANERIGTSATVVTLVRTAIAVALGVYAARESDIGLLIAALAVYWVGDMLDGYVARVRGCETRIGAAIDILCDRFCCAVFYIGLMWLEPDLSPAIVIYLAEFMVVDCFLSLAFLAWPVRSPNYFFVIDRQTWLWNWSKPAKAVNSSLFAVLLLVVNEYAGAGWAVTLGTPVASSLLVMKTASLVRLVRIGIPIPSR